MGIGAQIGVAVSGSGAAAPGFADAARGRAEAAEIRACADALGWRLVACADDGGAQARALVAALADTLPPEEAATAPGRPARLFAGAPEAALARIAAERAALADGARLILAGGVAPQDARAALAALGLDPARTHLWVADAAPASDVAPPLRLVLCDAHGPSPLARAITHPRAPLARDAAALLAARRLAMRGAAAAQDHGRAAAARWAAAHAPAVRADVRIARVSPWLRRYEPAEACGGTLAYIHGGGLVYYDLDVFDGLMTELAAHSRRPILAFGYERCPETDAGAVIDGLLERLAAHVPQEPDQIVAGDSIGGLLALYGAHRLRDRFARAVLVYPVLALAETYPSYELYGERRLLDASAMRWFRALVAPALAERRFDPMRLAPGDLGRTAVSVVSAGCDVLADEAAAFAARSPTPVRHLPLADLPHDFCLHAGTLASARDGVGAIVAMLATSAETSA